jgi:hypothetical protein
MIQEQIALVLQDKKFPPDATYRYERPDIFFTPEPPGGTAYTQPST